MSSEVLHRAWGPAPPQTSEEGARTNACDCIAIAATIAPCIFVPIPFVVVNRAHGVCVMESPCARLLEDVASCIAEPMPMSARVPIVCSEARHAAPGAAVGLKLTPP